jgi:DNA-binding transcriptional ArsR family regulator
MNPPQEPPQEPPKTATETLRPDLKRLASALGHTTRWKMLRELSAGEPRTIDEMAKVAGCSYDNASKHLGMLRKAGLVVQGRGRLYELPKSYLPAPGQPVVDFGHCLLRLDEV